MTLIGCIKETPWFSMINLCCVIGIAAVAYVRKDELREQSGDLFDFQFASTMMALAMAGLILVDIGITFQAMLSSEYCLTNLLGDKETRSQGGCGKCLGDLVCWGLAWLIFIIAYVVTVITIFVLIIGVAIPLLAICFKSLCNLDVDQFTDQSLAVGVANTVIEFIAKNERKMGLPIGLSKKFCTSEQIASAAYLTNDCILFNGVNGTEDCYDNSMYDYSAECDQLGFCQMSKDVVELCGKFGVVCVLLVIFQINFVVIARGNLVNTKNFQKEENEYEENVQLKSSV